MSYFDAIWRLPPIEHDSANFWQYLWIFHIDFFFYIYIYSYIYIFLYIFCDCIYTRVSSPGHSFAFNGLSHLSLSRLPPHCGGSPLNQGPITLPLENRPFSLMQAAWHEVSTRESHFHQMKNSLQVVSLRNTEDDSQPPSEERVEQHPGHANLKTEHVNSVKYIIINDINYIREQASGQGKVRQSEKLLLGSMGRCIRFLSFLFVPLDADKSHSRAWAFELQIIMNRQGRPWWHPGTREKDIFSWLFRPHGELHQGPHKSLIGLGSGEFGGQVKALGSGLSRFLDGIWGLPEHIILAERGWRDVYRYGQILIRENQVWVLIF